LPKCEPYLVLRNGNENGEDERARDLWTNAVESEVRRRLDHYLGAMWMVLRVDRRCVPRGANLAECYETKDEFIIMGHPKSDDESHDCDAMGCGTLSHVLHRIPKTATATAIAKAKRE